MRFGVPYAPRAYFDDFPIGEAVTAGIPVPQALPYLWSDTFGWYVSPGVWLAARGSGYRIGSIR